MAKESMKILLHGYLDEAQTTNSINKQLRRIEKNLKLKIGIDNKQLANLVRDVQKIQSKLNNKVTPISDKDTKQAKVFVDSIEKAVEQYSKLGQVKINQKINPNTKEIEAFTLAVTQADGKLKEFQFTQSKLKGIHGAGNYTLTGESLKDNTIHIRERQLQQEQQIKSQIEQQNQKLKHQLEMYKQEASLKARSLIDANRGNKNFDEASVRNWLNSVNALNSSTPQVAQQMDRLRMQFRSINADAQASSNQVRNFGNTMENAFSRMPIYMAASAAIFAPFVALNKLIDTLYILDERLVTIDKVTENISMADVFDKATEAAYRFGRTIDGALESYGEIIKLGFSAKDAGVLSDNSLLMATVGEMADIEAANYLVAVTRQYKLEIEETAKVVDAFNELSNKSGATVQGLAEGFSKSSAGAAQAGVSFHDLNGMMATTIETLKISGSEAGNFYKTLFNRYLRERTQSALNEIGIQTKNMNGELRSATDVLQELGKKWRHLDSQQKNVIASQLGGGWHINKVSSLIENQARAYENAQFSLNSYNSAQKELETFQEGLQFKTNNMIASFQELAMTIGENGARDGIVKILEAITSLTQGFTEVTEATDGWNIKLPILIGLIYGGTKAFGALRLALTGVKSAMGIFGVGIVGLEMLASVFAKSASGANLNTEALTDLAKKTNDQTHEVENLVNQYTQLEPQAKNNAEKQDQLNSILTEIQKLAPHLVESTGQYGEALSLNTEKADSYIESLKKMTQEQLALAQSANAIELSNVNVDIDKEQEKLSKLEKSVKDSFERMQEYQNTYNVKGLQDAEEEYNKRRVDLAKKASEAIDKGNEELAGKMTIQLTEMLNEYAEYVKIMEDKNGKLEKYSGKISKIQELESKKKGIEERTKALEELASKTDKNTTSNEKHADSLTKLNDGIYESGDGFDSLGESMGDFAGDVSKLNKQYDNAISNISSLNSVINDLNDKHQVSADVIGTIMEKYPHLISYLGDETALRQKVAEQIAKEEKVAKQAMLGKLQANESFYKASIEANTKQVKVFQDAYGIDLKAYKSLGQAKIAIENKVLAMLTKAWDSHTQKLITMNKIAMMSGNPTAMGIGLLLSTLKDRATEVQGVFDDIFLDQIDLITGTSIATSGLSDSTKKVTKEYENFTYVADKTKSALEKLNVELEKQRSIQAKFPDHSKEYQNALQSEMKLLEDKKKLLKDQSKEIDKQIRSGKIQKTGVVSTNSASVSSSSSIATGGSNADTTWNFFKSKGFSDTIVAGIMGNLRLESNLNPNALNKSSGAFGIAQWLGGRKTGLQNYAKSIGSSANNLMTQLEWLWKELNSTEKKTLNWLNGNQLASSNTVAHMFDKLFERSEGTHVPQRQQYASQYLSQYSDKAVTVSGSVSKESSDASRAMAEGLSDIDQARSEWNQLQIDILKTQEEIDNLVILSVEKGASVYQNLISGVDRYLSKSQNILSTLKEGSEEWTKEVNGQIKQQKYRQDLMHKEANYYREQLKNDKLSARVKDELQKKISELSIAWWDVQSAVVSLNKSLEDMREDAAEKAIDAIKRSYEMQRDYLTKLKEHEIKQLEESHKRKMDMYDEDLRRYEEIINAQIRKIDDKSDEDSFNTDISKMQKSQMDLQSKISKLAMSTSLSDQLKKIELEEELNNIIEQINQKRADRSKELQKRSLSDQLDTFKKETDAKKKSETDSFNATKDRLDKEKRQLEIYYNEWINNEAYYARLRQQIINGNIDETQTKLNSFLKSFSNMNKDTVIEITGSWNSLLSLIGSVHGAMGNLGSSGGSSGGVIVGNGSAWDKYLDNKKQWETGNLSQAQKDQLRKENDQLRKEHGFVDGSYDQLKKYHDGGVVGGKENRITKFFNKLANVSPNEQVAKLLKGEYVLTQNHMHNILGNMKNMLQPQFIPLPSTGNTYHMSPTIQVTVKGTDKNIGKTIANETFKALDDAYRGFGK